MPSKFKYSFRPGYGSANFLIELLDGTDDDYFAAFMDAIQEINPMVTGSADLWMNDEFQLHLTSDIGSFSFSKDSWGFVFIEASHNQEGLKKIDSLLMIDDRFEKEAVNFDDYK